VAVAGSQGSMANGSTRRPPKLAEVKQPPPLNEG